MNFILMGAIVSVALAVGLISRKYLGDDNSLEEVSEEVIKKETGIDVDLSPKTQEGKDGHSK